MSDSRNVSRVGAGEVLESAHKRPMSRLRASHRAVSYREYDRDELPDLSPSCTAWVNPESGHYSGIAGPLAIIRHKEVSDGE